ncbi:MAG: uncharacterized protein JWP06_206 [Candidatus Saccharibacteria bacterium]|nr:uncharacterized protein [Candidatus Saccharibacteria bacterium]
MKREDILAEIRRTAQENEGKPLGAARFEQVTGIRPYDWSRYWPRFGDAQVEAGFEANKFNNSFSDDYLMEKLISMTRELGHFPVEGELRIKRINDPDFPHRDVFRRLGSKSERARRVLLYSAGKIAYSDMEVLLIPVVGEAAPGESRETMDDTQNDKYGFVYLVKGHPGEYKIGRTNFVDRRLSELGATASIAQELIHEIKTDDPAGIEAYWHRRFDEKRMKGEWFKLSAAEVKMFKRWRRIY